MTVTFSFELDTKYMKHLKDKSYYNHNYYELDLNHYGDYILPEMCDILFEYCDEFSETYTYTLGYPVQLQSRIYPDSMAYTGYRTTRIWSAE